MGEVFLLLPKTINRRKFQLKRKEHSRWNEQESQGTGIESFRDNAAGNIWLLGRGPFQHGCTVQALKLRTNTEKTRVVRRWHVLCECVVNKKA